VTVVVIGDALIDELRDESGSVDVPGGSALNVAVGLSILGVQASLIATYADDADGRALEAHLAAYHVSALVSPCALGTGRAVSDRSQAEPRYSFNPAAIARSIDFSPAMRAAIVDADLVAISGFPFDNQDQFEQLLEVVAGSTVLLDPNPRAGLMRDSALFAENLERFAPSLRLLKLGEDDARLLYGASLDEVVGYFAPQTTVLATAGAKGATVYEHRAAVSRPIVQCTEPIVDTLGAGDATFAAVIASLSDGETRWGVILDHAMTIAAATIRHHGGVLRTH
jgi:fructokinase